MALDFDPIDRAAQFWSERIGDASAMRAATAMMRAQQLLLADLDAALKPFGITFARYEVLRLLSFSKSGALPLSIIGERLMVHPTSVTSLIERLVKQGLVSRTADASDRRKVLASLTSEGAEVLDGATNALMSIEFGLEHLDGAQRDTLYDLLGIVRRV